MDFLNTLFTEISSSAINSVSIATLLKLYIICLQVFSFSCSNLSLICEMFVKCHENPIVVSL